MKSYIQGVWHQPTKKQEALVYAVYGSIAFVAVLLLNYRQALYGLDLPQHLHSALNGKGYSLVSFLLKYSYMLTDSVIGCAVLLSLTTVGTFFTIAYCFSVCANESSKKYNRLQCFLITAPLCFISSLYIPVFSPFYYKGSFLTQPLHNSTYTMMRLTGFLVVGFYITIRNKYLKSGITFKEWLVFFVLLSVTNAFKPNFVMFFAPAMLCELVYDFAKSRGKKLKEIVLFGMAVLCSLPILYLQFNVLYPGSTGGEPTSAKGEPSHIVFGLKHFFEVTSLKSIAIHLFCSLLFVIAVTILCVIKKHISRNLIFGWLMFLFAYADRSLFSETGVRATHGNFIWGIYMATLLLTVICLERLLSMRSNIKKPLYFGLLLLLMLMVACGVAYFCIILKNNYPIY